MSLVLFLAVSALLVTWAFLRWRRIEAATWGDAGVATDSGLISQRPTCPRPTLAQLGFNRLGRALLGMSALSLTVDVMLFSTRGLALDWSTVWFGELILSVLLVAWLICYFLPGTPKEWFTAEVMLVTFLCILFTNVVSPMQYGAVAVGAPYADWWLAAGDAKLGVHVPTLAAWTRAHPVVALAAYLIYNTFLPQMVLTILVLAVLGDRERVWEFAFHFHFCLFVTVAALMVVPAICPPAHYGFVPTIDMNRLIAQIKTFHDGTATTVRFNELEGLVSFPSFHVAGALIVTWAFRSRRGFFVPLLLLNGAMVISTFITGVHYVVDVLAAVPLLVASVVAYRWWAQPTLVAACGSCR